MNGIATSGISAEIFMQRCIDLALLGAGKVAPNPMVGAVLVHEGKIIGEGFHQKYGEAHAEVNCIGSVKPEDRHLISRSTLFVSLEPCAHHGKTPPCADLIIRENIPAVVVGCRDPFPEVNGKGITKLEQAGVTVTVGVLENDCLNLNRRFFTFHTKQRPYIILKWAETSDGFIGTGNSDRLMISNESTNRLVHRWRSEESTILIGTNTALYDDPVLNNRLWEGETPLRLVLDLSLRLPSSLRIFNDEQQTVIFNGIRQSENGHLLYQQLENKSSIIAEIVRVLYDWKKLSLLVEGGAQLLQSFIDEAYWDEARVITNSSLKLNKGIAAPHLGATRIISKQKILNDNITIYKSAD